MLTLKVTAKDIESQLAPVREVGERISKPQAMLREIGLYMLGSIAKNFRQGGRPIRWKPSRRAITQAGKTLVDTARLKNSITMKVHGKVLKLGTNVKYAAIHHFGGNINKNVTVKKHFRVISRAFGKPIAPKQVSVRSHSRNMNLTIEARPFLLVQEADWRVITRIGRDYVITGRGAG